MSDSTLIEERLQNFIAGPDDSDWEDVLRRAVAIAAATNGAKPKRGPVNRRRWRPLLVAAVAAAAVAGVGIAIAAGFGAFDGISAAQHPQRAEDVLDPALAAQINAHSAPFDGMPTGKLLPETARFIRALARGDRVYTLTTTTDMLCVLIVRAPISNMSYAIGCGQPLGQSEPTTIETLRDSPATAPLAFGVAIDGVMSVSFMAGGVETTVPVDKNVWAYEGESNALGSLTVHFADGTSQTLTHGRVVGSGGGTTTTTPDPGQGSTEASTSAPPSPLAADWRAVVNDLMANGGTFTRDFPCASVRTARARIAALPHPSSYLAPLAAYLRARC
jgi:hypothetical protein